MAVLAVLPFVDGLAIHGLKVSNNQTSEWFEEEGQNLRILSDIRKMMIPHTALSLVNSEQASNRSLQ